MDQKEINGIVEQVVARCREALQATLLKTDGGACEIPLEVSARHVHLTHKAVEALFGPGAELVPKRPLSQPGEFLSEQRVKLVTARGSVENVAVLGPERADNQCELSMTDCRALGIEAPVNLSGDLTGAGDIIMVGPAGVLDAKGCVIVARAHIHMTPGEAAALCLTDGQHICVSIKSARPVTLEDVVVRVKDTYAPAMHIDFDEANACSCDKDTKIAIVPETEK